VVRPLIAAGIRHHVTTPVLVTPAADESETTVIAAEVTTATGEPTRSKAEQLCGSALGTNPNFSWGVDARSVAEEGREPKIRPRTLECPEVCRSMVY
jgi:hypothetical protein